MRDIVASIHPRHAQAILNGTKTIELRRKLPKQSVGLMYIYETAPTSMVIGAVQVMAVDGRQKGEMWAVHGPWSGVTETEFYDYFDGAALAGSVAVILQGIVLLVGVLLVLLSRRAIARNWIA